MATALFLPKKLEDRLTALFDKLVSSSGPAGTLEGEAVRAINSILYRYYNDGDHLYKGYGIETAGSAAAFLMSSSCPVDVKSEIDKSDGVTGHAYERALFAAVKKIVDHVEARDGDFRESPVDMFDFEAKYEPEDDSEEEEDDFNWDEED